MDDIMMFMKIIAVVGANIQPVAAVLPMRVLLEMVEVSVAQDLSSKVIDMLTAEVDSRMKEMVTGDKEYKLGDMTKKALTGSKDYQAGDFTKSILNQITSRDYEFGDVTKSLLKKEDKSVAQSPADRLHSDDEVKQKMDEWDKKYLASKKDDSTVEKLGLEAWDEKLLNHIDRS